MWHKLFLILALFSVNFAVAQSQQDSADIQRLMEQERARQEAEARRRAAQQQANSINPSALTGKDSQKKGAGANTAAGIALIATGTAMMANPPTVPPGAALVAMGILALMQADHDKKAANASATTANASQLSGATYTNPTDPSGQFGFSDPRIAQAQKQLQAAGYKMTSKGLHHPDGSFTPATAFNSPSSMAAAGLDENTIKETQKALGAVNEEISKYKVSSVAVDTGAGGAGASSEASVNEEQPSSSVFNPFGLSSDQKKALMAGKTVMFDGEPIAVSGSNIFDLVHVAYQTRRNGNQFIETENLRGSRREISVRGPASIGSSPTKVPLRPVESRAPNR